MGGNSLIVCEEKITTVFFNQNALLQRSLRKKISSVVRVGCLGLKKTCVFHFMTGKVPWSESKLLFISLYLVDPGTGPLPFDRHVPKVGALVGQGSDLRKNFLGCLEMIL